MEKNASLAPRDAIHAQLLLSRARHVVLIINQTKKDQVVLRKVHPVASLPELLLELLRSLESQEPLSGISCSTRKEARSHKLRPESQCPL